MEKVSETRSFKVKQIRRNTLENPRAVEHEDYYKQLADFTKKVRFYQHLFDKGNKKVITFKNNLKHVKNDRIQLTAEVYELMEIKISLEKELGGSKAKAEIGEKDFKSLYNRLYNAKGGWRPNTYGPTSAHMESFEFALEMFDRLIPKIDNYLEKIQSLNKKYIDSGAPLILD